METLSIQDLTGLEQKLATQASHGSVASVPNGIQEIKKKPVHTKRVALSIFIGSTIAFVLLCDPLKIAEGNYSMAFMLTVFCTLIPTGLTALFCFLSNLTLEGNTFYSTNGIVNSSHGTQNFLETDFLDKMAKDDRDDYHNYYSGAEFSYLNSNMHHDD